MEKKIEKIASFVKTMHIDIIDGKFADNTTFMDPDPFKKYTGNIFFEVHLMVDNPIQYLHSFEDAGFKRFIGQIEKMPDIAAFIAEGQLRGEVGLAIDKQTSIGSLRDYLADIDVLLIMTIQAGFSGQTFLPELLDKVKKIREINTFIPIEIDGGVSENTIVEAKEAGVNRFVATSAIYNAETPEQNYMKLMGLVK